MIPVIPAIDLVNGKVVRLSQGDFRQQTIYSDDPVSVAQQFEDAGLTRLHLVDLDGAKFGKVKQLAVLEQIVRATNLRVDFSGGIKTSDDLQQVLDAGAAVASIGSIAVESPDLLVGWLERFSGARIWLGVDALNGSVMVNGWQQNAGISLFQLVDRFYAHGLETIFCTSIERDGMLLGPSTSMYREIKKRYPDLVVIASGGVASLSDLSDLESAGCSGAIVGKAFYEGSISLAAVSKMNFGYGIN